MKFKKIAIIGKYPAAIESNEMDSQLIDLIEHLSKKDYAGSLAERIEMQKRDLEQFTPNSPNEFSLDKSTAEWLGIAGSTEQDQQ